MNSINSGVSCVSSWRYAMHLLFEGPIEALLIRLNAVFNAAKFIYIFEGIERQLQLALFSFL